jgi:hypothetical protein
MSNEQQNPESVVISALQGEGDKLGDVTVCTLQGDCYSFPNMNVTKLKAVLPEKGRRPSGMPCLVMVNMSMASLSVPFNIIERVSSNTEVLWHAPRSSER